MKSRAVSLTTVACVLAMLAFAACDSDPTGIPGAVLTLSPDSLILTAVGDSVYASSQLRGPQGDPIIAPVRWQIADTSIARVTADGAVVARRPGTTQLTAEAAGARDEVSIVVRQVVRRIELNGAPSSVASGDTVRLQLSVLDARGQAVPDAIVQWLSNEFAPVSPAGVVVLREAGVTEIIARSGNVADTVTVEVKVRFASVSAGGSHTCALAVNGDPYCFGSPNSGALGSGVSSGRNGPLLAHRSHNLPGGPLVQFRQITAGAVHTCAVTPTDRGYCWGPSLAAAVNVGQPYHATAHDSTLLFRSTSAGKAPQPHTCAVMRNETIRCWGFGLRGQMGRDTFVLQFPREVESPVRFTAVAAGGEHTCAVSTDQRVFCWGANDYGQLGLGLADGVNRTQPTELASNLRFVAVTAGLNHSCAITTAAELYCWGTNHLAQLTSSITNQTCTVATIPRACSTSPQRISLSGPVTQVSAGWDHTCAIAGTNAFCWGSNGTGQAGLAGSSIATSPVQLAGAWTSISAGQRHSCGMRGNMLVCWGDNSAAQLGTVFPSGITSEPIPVAFQQ